MKIFLVKILLQCNFCCLTSLPLFFSTFLPFWDFRDLQLHPPPVPFFLFYISKRLPHSCPFIFSKLKITNKTLRRKIIFVQINCKSWAVVVGTRYSSNGQRDFDDPSLNRAEGLRFLICKSVWNQWTRGQKSPFLLTNCDYSV